MIASGAFFHFKNPINKRGYHVMNTVVHFSISFFFARQLDALKMQLQILFISFFCMQIRSAIVQEKGTQNCVSQISDFIIAEPLPFFTTLMVLASLRFQRMMLARWNPE